MVEGDWAPPGHRSAFKVAVRFCSYTPYYMADLLARSLKGERRSLSDHIITTHNIRGTYRSLVRDFVQGQIIITWATHRR